MAPQLLERHCYDDSHVASFKNYPPFTHSFDPQTDKFAVQYDTCLLTSRWSDYNEWEQCSKTCDGGVQRRERFCEQYDRIRKVWFVNDDLIGQDCECQGEKFDYRPCNQGCCLTWHGCNIDDENDAGNICINDNQYLSTLSWQQPPCTGCGCPTVTGQQRCMCFDGPVSGREYPFGIGVVDYAGTNVWIKASFGDEGPEGKKEFKWYYSF